MKIKNKLLLVFVICLTALVAVSLVACNNNDGGGQDGNDPNNYEVAKYTVTFNTNSSDMTLANPVVRDIPHGTRVAEPTDENGNKIIPIKKGYTFKWWSTDGGDTAFDFTKGITANTTITATYTNNKYTHKAVLTAKLEWEQVYNEETKEYEYKFTVNEDARDVNDVSLPASETGPNTTLYSTYASSGDKLPCPTFNGTDEGQENKFCFWYYINEDGKPVQLSKWKADNAATVDHLVSYYLTNGLTVYPMFSDNLPSVTVKYAESPDSDKEPYKTQEFKFGENINKTDVPKDPTRPDYKFEDWYYIVEKTSNGTTTKENTTFLFAEETQKNPTSPMDAASASDNFTPVELMLYARWTRQVTITSGGEFKDFYDKFKALLTDPTDAQQTELDEILNANIVLNGNIDLSDMEFEPLFDSAHPFRGIIDGTTKQNETVSSKAIITGGVFGDATTASVFGYNAGTIKNIQFVDVGLKVSDKNANRVYMGVITTDNAGAIESCDVTIENTTIIDTLKLHTVVFGGVTAINHGSTSRDGAVTNCTATIKNFNAECEALTFGGIAGETNASASLVNDTVNIIITSIKCEDDGISANGRSYLNLGGLAGVSASSVRLCKVESFTVNAVESLTETAIGGAVGVNTGNIRVTFAKGVELGKIDDPIVTRGSISLATCIGGLAGKNEGYISDCYSDANLYVEVKNATNGSNLYIGGLVGSNYSDRKDSTSAAETGVCAINKGYSLGEIVVTVSDNVNAVNVYAGGIAGRNSHKKISSLFSEVHISVTNDGENYLGHMFGKMLNNVGTNGKVYYNSEAVINLKKGGREYEIKGDGKDSAEYVNFENIGEGVASANFKSATWVTGTTTESSTLGFNGNTWEVKNGEYPSFLEKVYGEETKTETAEG